MATVEHLVEYIAESALPFRNALYYSWSQWGDGKSQKPFEMSLETATAWMKVKTEQRTVSVRAQARPWDDSFGYARFLLDTFLILTPLNLGNFYEQYMRALLGAYKFTKSHPQFYPNGNLPKISKDEQLTLHSLRQRMVEVWKLPTMVLNVQGLMQQLSEQKTYEDLCIYFLENSPMMQNLLNARRDPNDKPINFKEQKAHLQPTALLDYLRVLLEDVVAKNLIVNQVDRSKEENSEYFDLTNQQRSETWMKAFPDRHEDELPMIQEFALDSRDLFQRSEKVQMTTDIFEAPGWHECIGEVYDGGKRTEQGLYNS